MKKTLWIGLALIVMGYAGRLAWRAQQDRVTLEVRDADLAHVVRSLRWQTWEPIYVGAGVSGRVTLRVKNQPLEAVLDIINEQINGRWSAVYPLYTSRKSLAAARALASGQRPAPVPGWTNWSGRPFGVGPAPGAVSAGGRPVDAIPAGPTPVRFPGGGPEGPPTSTRAAAISLHVTNLPPLQVAAVVRRQSGARLVPEDGTHLPVTLNLTAAPLNTVVAAIAKKTFRKWTRFYVFESRDPGPASRRLDLTGGERPAERPEPTAEQREQMRTQMAANPAHQEQAVNRMLSGLLNSTPQQRAERDALRLARQKAQARR